MAGGVASTVTVRAPESALTPKPSRARTRIACVPPVSDGIVAWAVPGTTTAPESRPSRSTWSAGRPVGRGLVDQVTASGPGPITAVGSGASTGAAGGTAAATSGRGPIAPASAPGCGCPVATSRRRTSLGVRNAPVRRRAAACSAAAAPATVAEALEVPLKHAV